LDHLDGIVNYCRTKVPLGVVEAVNGNIKSLLGFVANGARAYLVRCRVTRRRPALFRGRHFEDVIILLCVRWYLRYSLTYRDLEEIMAERNLSVDHVTIWRWVQRYAPILNQRIRREIRRPNLSWRVDETYVKVAGHWAYLYRAVDSAGETIEFMLSPRRDLIAAKLLLRLALSSGAARPRVINVDGLCSAKRGPSVTQRFPQANIHDEARRGRPRVEPYVPQEYDADGRSPARADLMPPGFPAPGSCAVSRG
jgi:transposase, IS6 family